MKDLLKLIRYKVHKKKATNFFELPSHERKEIFKKAGIEAQKEQRKLLNEYKVRFG